MLLYVPELYPANMDTQAAPSRAMRFDTPARAQLMKQPCAAGVREFI